MKVTTVLMYEENKMNFKIKADYDLFRGKWGQLSIMSKEAKKIMDVILDCVGKDSIEYVYLNKEEYDIVKEWLP